jgi:hypothetical protein
MNTHQGIDGEFALASGRRQGPWWAIMRTAEILEDDGVRITIAFL